MSFDLNQMRARVIVAPSFHTSFGPFRMLEAVPWLMLASSMRFVAYGMPGILALIALFIANIALCLALLVAAQRMIELSNGTIDIDRLSFRERSKLALAVVIRVLGLSIVAAVAAFLVKFGPFAVQMIGGFDGIAFDQPTKMGMVWSSFLACLVLVMVVCARRDGGKPSLRGALLELLQRAVWLVPAIVVTALLQIGLSSVQGVVRVTILQLYFDPSIPPSMWQRLGYFGFIFGFATLRLWVTLAVLIFALRESYRRSVRA